MVNKSDIIHVNQLIVVNLFYNLLMTFSNMSDVFITGMFWAYGFRKTGTLIPWIIIHAFSNIPYLF